MAYASSNFGGNKGCSGEPNGKGGGGTFASKAGSATAKSEPSGGMKSSGMKTKGNAKKL